MSTRPARSPGAAKPAPALTKALAAELGESLLPGDAKFTAGSLAGATAFLLAASASREPGEAIIAIESISGSATERFMRIALINDDMPFLVDSIAATITAQGLEIDRLVHPVLPVRRNNDGQLATIVPGEAEGESRESMIYVETPRVDARQRRDLETALRATLTDVRAAVADWPKLQAAMSADAETLGDTEGAALLRWFKDGMLTQLGHVTRHRDGSQTGALGICKRGARTLLGPISYERAFAYFDAKMKAKSPQRQAPLAVKSNTVSNVHRRTPLDLFIVPVLTKGKVTALSVHTGIWTSAALAATPQDVPRMRTQLTELMTRFGFAPQGHAGKALVHALTALPHDLLTSFADDDLERVATAMMSLTDRPRPKLALVPSALLRHLFAFVWLPRDVLSTATRLQIEAMLVEACGAPVLDWSLEVEGGIALLRYVLDLPAVAKVPAEAPLDARLQGMLRGWNEAVESEIAASEEPSRAAAIAARHAEAFPLAYRALYGPAEAAVDIARLRRLAPDDSTSGTQRDARLHRLAGDPAGSLRLKLYQRHGSLALSDVVPALENFGFRVIEDQPTALDEGRLGTIHDFLLALPMGLSESGVLARSEAIESALADVLNGVAEDDPFNRLITTVALSAREGRRRRAWDFHWLLMP